MKAVLDDKIFFSEKLFELDIKSLERSVIQRAAAGLDGQVSIDLGMRRRKLVQKGELRAKSQAELQRQIDAINELVDGKLHSLTCSDGRVFGDLLIENFQTDSFVCGGAHTSSQYQITYTQQG